MNHAQYESAVKQIVALQTENDRLRAALVEYANHHNWSTDDNPTGYQEFPDCWNKKGHGWEIAEHALKGESS